MMKLIEPMPMDLAAPVVSTATAKRDRRRRGWLASAAAISLLALGAIGYSQLHGTAPPATAASGSQPATVEVKTTRAIRQVIRKTIEQPGRLEGDQQTPMSVKMPGFVREWKTDIGATVVEGQVLAELSVPEEVEELKRREAVVTFNEAAVVAAEKALDAAIADEARAEAIVRQSLATRDRTEANVTRWKADFKRTELGRDKGASSQNDYDVSLESLRTAEAALAEAKAGIDSAQAGLASAMAAKVRAQAAVQVAKSQVAVAEADARRQRAWLTYATVRAPFTGIVTQRNVEVGQYVMPPTAGSNQAPLFVVVRTDPVRVMVDVPESEAALVHENMPVMVRIQTKGDLEVPARVSRVSWALDQSSRTLRVQVDLPNANNSLRPGLFAIVRFNTERPGAWVVPASVVATADEQPYAVRVENGKSIKTPVKLGSRQNGMVEIIQKQTRAVPRGEQIPWEALDGNEDFLLTRPAGWTDGMSVTAANR